MPEGQEGLNIQDPAPSQPGGAQESQPRDSAGRRIIGGYTPDTGPNIGNTQDVQLQPQRPSIFSRLNPQSLFSRRNSNSETPAGIPVTTAAEFDGEQAAGSRPPGGLVDDERPSTVGSAAASEETPATLRPVIPGEYIPPDEVPPVEPLPGDTPEDVEVRRNRIKEIFQKIHASRAGKLIEDTLWSAVAGGSVKYATNAAFLAAGASWGSGIAAGTIVGATREAYRKVGEIEKANKTPEEIRLLSERSRLARANIIKRYRAIEDSNNKKEVWKAVGKGAVKGAVGGAIGSLAADYLSNNGADIWKFVNSQIQEIQKYLPNVGNALSMPGKATMPDAAPVTSGYASVPAFQPEGEQVTVGDTTMPQIDAEAGQVSPNPLANQAQPGVSNPTGTPDSMSGPSADELAERARIASSPTTQAPPSVLPSGSGSNEMLDGSNSPIKGIDSLQQSIDKLPKEIVVQPSDGAKGVWGITQQLLHDVDPAAKFTDADIMEIDKELCRLNGVSVPGWGINGTIDHRAIQAGFKFKVDDDEFKKLLIGVAKKAAARKAA